MNILVISEYPLICQAARTTINFLFNKFDLRACRHVEAISILEQAKKYNDKPNLVIFDLDSRKLSENDMLKLHEKILGGDYLEQNCTFVTLGSYSPETTVGAPPLLKKPFSIHQMTGFLSRNLLISDKLPTTPKKFVSAYL